MIDKRLGLRSSDNFMRNSEKDVQVKSMLKQQKIMIASKALQEKREELKKTDKSQRVTNMIEKRGL